MPFEKGEIPKGAKPFEKGKSGNPNGRPKKLPEIDKLLAEVLGEDKEGVTAAEAILKALRAKAAKGDIRAAEVLLDRAYGKVKQSLDLSNLGGKFESAPPDLTHLTFDQLKELQRGSKGDK